MEGLGIIGGGQLAWMMADASTKLDIPLYIQTPDFDDPAVKIASQVVLAPVAEAKATYKLADYSRIITFENEFVDLDALEELELSGGVSFKPSISALRPLLDKYQQRVFLQSLGIASPTFRAFRIGDPVEHYPIVLKSRRHGYDGQGTFIVHDQQELSNLSSILKNVPLLLEEYVPFVKELAIVAARSSQGELAVYPVVETYQKNQVCHWVIAPADISPELDNQTKEVATKLLSSLNYVGLLGIEFFLTENGQVLVNEVAPRTHNSGHYTLDACSCSQFEMHIRAVMGLPLASNELQVNTAVMVNLLGYEVAESDYLEKRKALAALNGAHVYWYGKQQSKIGRKLGHVTVTLPSRELARDVIEKIEKIWLEL
jgi:5-(carboxyamino)imidazole ribonucleotide synthase